MNYAKIFFCVFLLFCLSCQDNSYKSLQQNFITSDITNFWKAYDAISATKDTTEQQQLLTALFLDPASEGQKAMIQARRYTPAEYLHAINAYPAFWQSIRPNTLRVMDFAENIATGVYSLDQLYPIRSTGKVYFTMGVFRSPGTTLDSLVLIGSELAFGDSSIRVEELPENLDYVKNYFQLNPIRDLPFLNVHEFVHTQQQSAMGSPLITQCLREGIAEFIAVKATSQPSPTPAIQYGRQHPERIKTVFKAQIQHQSIGFWLWSSQENEFNMRDLGYYVGYAIAEGYYHQHDNQQQAIKTLIELDFQDQQALDAVIDQSGYFDQSMQVLRQAYEDSRPRVINITEFENGAQTVDPGLRKITLTFSTPLDRRFRSTDLGELGIEHFPRFDSISIAADGRSAIYHLKPLEANKVYQMVAGSSYRSESGVRLSPYLIDFKTK